MKIAKNIFLVLGIIFILFNLMGFLGGASPYPKDGTTDTSYRIAYFIGSFLFIIIGLVFLFISYRFSKKIQKKKNRELVDSLLSDQDNQVQSL